MTDLTDLTIQELIDGREETFSSEMLTDIDAELRRRIGNATCADCKKPVFDCPDAFETWYEAQ